MDRFALPGRLAVCSGHDGGNRRAGVLTEAAGGTGRVAGAPARCARAGIAAFARGDEGDGQGLGGSHEAAGRQLWSRCRVVNSSSVGGAWGDRFQRQPRCQGRRFNESAEASGPPARESRMSLAVARAERDFGGLTASLL